MENSWYVLKEKVYKYLSGLYQYINICFKILLSCKRSVIGTYQFLSEVSTLQIKIVNVEIHIEGHT